MRHVLHVERSVSQSEFAAIREAWAAWLHGPSSRPLILGPDVRIETIETMPGPSASFLRRARARVR